MLGSCETAEKFVWHESNDDKFWVEMVPHFYFLFHLPDTLKHTHLLLSMVTWILWDKHEMNFVNSFKVDIDYMVFSQCFL